MRRRPELERPLDPDKPGQPGPRPPPTARPDSVQPFLTSGGAGWFLPGGETDYDPAPDGVQLVTSVYIPRGQVGFLKELRCAPFIPAILSDPWNTTGVTLSPDDPPLPLISFRTWSSVPSPRAVGTNGVWTTPFGWESYFDAPNPPPTWTWHLRLIAGDIALLRAQGTNLPPFNIADPQSWYLVPNIAVPATAYPNGIPGRAPGLTWGPQRMQVLQGDKLSLHVPIPEDTTLCLFTRWTQTEFQPLGTVAFGPDDGQTQFEVGNLTFPLLPSFGQLLGYTQAVSSEAATENALYGWGG